MDNEQLNSNLNELIKNQIEICEKLDKMDRKIKKLIKPKKESNLNNIFGNPVDKLNDITDIRIKTDQNESLEKQANELIDKFMPLVNGWDKNQPKHNECYQGAINEPVIGLWYYSQQNQRKAAIKCAIVHCELMSKEFETRKYLLTELKQIDLVHLKSKLQKMLSE